jgi:hypothetical protein
MGNFDKNLEKLVKCTLEFLKSKFSQIIHQKIVKFCLQKKHYSYSNSQYSSYNSWLLGGDFEMFRPGIEEWLNFEYFHK